jgi:succinyl-diaminopimelate desuccinylase
VALNLEADLTQLFIDIVNVESVSGNEGLLADLVEAALLQYPHLNVKRFGDTVIARTDLGRPQRVVVAGHLDTVPIANNLPARRDGEVVYGRGTADMKGGVAVALAAAAALKAPSRDVTWIFYDHEEVNADLNALGHIDPAELQGDLAILMEPTSAKIEGGCQGNLRFVITTRGKAAHSARAWTGHNAIHDVFDVLARLYRYKPRMPQVDGLTYHEGLNAVKISGGIATNVIPDKCQIEINFRFAPDLDEAAAKRFCEQTFVGYDLEYVDFALGARPGLDLPIARDFLKAVGTSASAKFGWTDVARFSALGIPALNFGPGNPSKAHTDDESCEIAELGVCYRALVNYLDRQGG